MLLMVTMLMVFGVDDHENNVDDIECDANG